MCVRSTSKGGLGSAERTHIYDNVYARKLVRSFARFRSPTLHHPNDTRWRMSRRTNCVLVRTCIGMYFVCFSSEPQPAALLLLFNMCTRDICFHCSMPNTRPHYATTSTTTTGGGNIDDSLTNTHRGHTCTRTLSFCQLCEAQMRGCWWAVSCVCVCMCICTDDEKCAQKTQHYEQRTDEPRIGQPCTNI